MKDNTTREEKKRRVKVLNEYSETAYRDYGNRFFGTKREAILENGGEFITDNYIKIQIRDSQLLKKLKTGQFVNIKPTSYFKSGENSKGIFMGELVHG